MPVASELLPTYLSAPEWEKHHAALIALAQIAEGCSKVPLLAVVLLLFTRLLGMCFWCFLAFLFEAFVFLCIVRMNVRM